MDQPLYSIRMHSTLEGAHLSGGERLGFSSDLEELSAALVRRALAHQKGCADRIRLTLEAIPPSAVRRGRLPDLTTLRVTDYRQGRQIARELLMEAGVAAVAADAAMEAMARGAASGGVSMRGAMLIDAFDGRRLEPDPIRGVRASRMDLSQEAEALLRKELSARGLDNPHVREALVLSAKVLSAPGIMAELCWSDDPDYTAGYVASPKRGYRRFAHLKPAGEPRGGRAFFLRREGLDLPSLINYLESEVLLVTEIGAIGGDIEWEGPNAADAP